jgi:cellulose synthase/poly-beta-1,6-N-acetylglucosamine synthase-like glycosyltransferase
MDFLFLRIIEKILIIYFAAYFLIDVVLFIYSLFIFLKKKNASEDDNYKYDQYPVTIIVPAYNEVVSIVDCLEMLLQLDYPDYELVVVNDGSTDNTMQTLEDAFELETIETKIDPTINTSDVRRVLISKDKKLRILDKENGGKADAINSGINCSTKDFICTIDADSILDPNALKEAIKPFVKDSRCIVSGGQLAASNDVQLENNVVISSRTPRNIWAIWQITEYIKSFMISRLALSKINALLIMSGAFSMYRKSDLQQIGGFLSRNNNHPYILNHLGKEKQTVCEDMEIVVRLFHYRRNHSLKSRIFFLPKPVCWTEVPEDAKSLYKQRSRWHQGLAETLKIHIRMLFEPKYGTTAMIGLPYYFFFELLSPIVKTFTFLFLAFSIWAGTLNYQWLVLFLISVILASTIIITSITAIIENWSMKQSHSNREALRYKGFFDWLWLIFAAILGEFSYSFVKIAAQLNGLYNFFRRRSDWKKFDRKGLKRK